MRYELRPKIILLGVLITMIPFIIIDALFTHIYLMNTYSGEIYMPPILEIIVGDASPSLFEFVFGRLLMLYFFSIYGLMQTCLVGLTVTSFGLISTKRRTAYKIIIIVAVLYTVVFYGLLHTSCKLTFMFDLFNHPYCDEVIAARLAPN